MRNPETEKQINDIEPYQWLKNTLDQIPNHHQEKLHELLPLKQV